MPNVIMGQKCSKGEVANVLRITFVLSHWSQMKSTQVERIDDDRK